MLSGMLLKHLNREDFKMVDLADIYRQKAFYEGGGGEEPVTDKINKIFSTISQGGLDMSKMKNDAIDRALKKKQMQIADEENKRKSVEQSSKLTPVRDLQFPITPTNATINESTTPEQREEIDALYKNREAVGDVNLEQANTLSEINKRNTPDSARIELSLRPAISSGYVSREFVKSIFPDLPEGGDISIGELQQRAQLAKNETTLEAQERARLEAEKRQAEREANKPLSGEAAKVNAIATTITPEIEKLKSSFSKDYQGALSGIVSGTDRELVKLVDNIADKIGRLRSGGAINKEEESRFKRQIAGLMDIPFGKPEEAIAALDGILAEASSVSSSIRPSKPKDIAPKPPKRGDVQDGHRFKGGDPADRNNWIKL